MNPRRCLFLFAAIVTAFALAAHGQDTPQRKPGDNLLFNGWGVTPAGEHVKTSDLPLKMLVAPDKKRLVSVNGGFGEHGLSIIDIAGKRLTQFLPVTEAWNGLAFSRDGRRIFVAAGDDATIHVFRYADGTATADRVIKPDPKAHNAFLAGLAVHPTTGTIYACDLGGNEVWALDGETLELRAKIAVGSFPHSCVVGADKRHLYVSNWGGRSVTIVDLNDNRRVRDITVGIRPNDMALAPDGRLFIACAGDNSVHVVKTAAVEGAPLAPNSSRVLSDGPREIISTSIYPQSPEGSTPDAVVVAPDGKTLFVANADNNCVMLVDISGATLNDEVRRLGQSISVVNGFIPTGWYPSAIAVGADGTLFVGNGKGLRSQANVAPPDNPPRRQIGYIHIGKTLEGSISFVAPTDAAKMAEYTQQVRRNSPFTPQSLRRSALKSECVIPDVVGRECPIKYVLYVIKENRTYDQVFGDMTDKAGKPIGNGDRHLTLYGEAVTPNQHQLARDYVLLDNLYCNGEVSADGHSWCDAAFATDFNQRSWLLSYSKHKRLPGNAEMETPAAGYLWDLCRRHGVTYRNYGEGASKVAAENRGKWPAPWKERDMDRVRFWIDDLKAAEKAGTEPPQFTIMELGENHTQAASPGWFTPNACVASNDLAVGRIVEAASRSKFWKEMAIFIIEDDAQNGPDHVDAHRTTGLVISPYCKRGVVDSTLYTTASMIRTMELILGLPPLTQYDAGATPMFHCFGKDALITPFTPLEPKVDLKARNPARGPGAEESARMDWKDYDDVPEDEVNRILWRLAKGPDVPYPPAIHRALFTK
jgi:DNA-binding beta-propeller fold protein YncE